MSQLQQFIDQWRASTGQIVVLPEVLMACIDLTSLNDTDDEHSISVLCAQAVAYKVASVCVYPQFISVANRQLAKAVAIATVANFPSGTADLTQVLTQIRQSIDAGATEIDVVLPYQEFLTNKDSSRIVAFVKACKAECGAIVLKTIVESGAMDPPRVLEHLALAALEGGSDFLKTSSGKVLTGATLEAAAILLGALKAFGDERRGFKASGGVKTYKQAKEYWLLSALIMGENWPTPARFRLGASSLLTELAAQCVNS
jgi:deoxyribose-phosphate aldolase